MVGYKQSCDIGIDQSDCIAVYDAMPKMKKPVGYNATIWTPLVGSV